MTDWEERLFTLFDDLEQQAEAAFAVERDLEVADRLQAEYARIGVATRLMASVGRTVRLRVTGVGSVEGELRRVADGWCLVAGTAGEWLVRTAAIQSAAGLSSRSVPEAAWPVTSRLGIGSALRGLAEDGQSCRLVTSDGGSHDVRLGRVGADFVEGYVGDAGDLVVVWFAALAAVIHHPR